ncbi:hypothetical protein JW960_28215 [candidate division KSB1 bacterium]|nr:hypothetical protein [candidate division KSB1 bacterium]
MVSEGKTASQIVRELTENYVQVRDISQSVDSLWNRIGEELIAAGTTVQDVDDAIQAVRKSKK